MRILGVDPGLRLTGYACLETHVREPQHPPGSQPYAVSAALQPPSLIEAGVIRLKAGRPLTDRLLELERDLSELIDRTQPEVACVEALFSHYAHPATAVTMGHARGVILLTIRRKQLRLLEFKPNAIKKHVTGNGHASKPQMQAAVRALLCLAEPPDPPDVADAIAIALCAAARVESVVE